MSPHALLQRALATTIIAAAGPDGRPQIASAAYQRSAQVLLAGHVPLIGASPALADALRGVEVIGR